MVQIDDYVDNNDELFSKATKEFVKDKIMSKIIKVGMLEKEVTNEINEELIKKAKKILKIMKKEIDATELVLANMKKKYEEFKEKNIKDLTFEEVTPKLTYNVDTTRDFKYITPEIMED